MVERLTVELRSYTALCRAIHEPLIRTVQLDKGKVFPNCRKMTWNNTDLCLKFNNTLKQEHLLPEFTKIGTSDL